MTQAVNSRVTKVIRSARFPVSSAHWVCGTGHRAPGTGHYEDGLDHRLRTMAASNATRGADRARRVRGSDRQVREDVRHEVSVLVDDVHVAVFAVGESISDAINRRRIHAPLESKGMIRHA